MLATFVPWNDTLIAFQREMVAKQLEEINAAMHTPFTVKHLFVLCMNEAGRRVEPRVEGDKLYLHCEQRVWRELYTKTFEFWTTIRSIVDARFYAKRETDSVICWRALINQLQRAAAKGKPVYAGGLAVNVPVVSPRQHPRYDRLLSEVSKFTRVYWPYAQEPFYVLSDQLVDSFTRRRPQMQPFVNEAAMVGAWALRFDKTMLGLPLAQGCDCSRDAVIFSGCPVDSLRSACSSSAFEDRCLRTA